MGFVPKQLSRDAEVWLRGYGWPGNVRELSHLMERVTLLSTQRSSSTHPPWSSCACRDRSCAVRSGAPPVRGEAEPLDEPARMRQALSQTRGNVVQAARLLGISRGALRYWMRRYGIGRPNWQALTPPHSSQDQEAIGPSEADQWPFHQRGSPSAGTCLGAEACGGAGDRCDVARGHGASRPAC